MISFKSAGVSVRTINLSGPTSIQPSGIPAGVIGTSLAGPAFVPVTVATTQDFAATFGETSNDVFHGPLAVSEWLRNAQAATFIRVLGVGGGADRETTAESAGKVAGAGFVVGNQIPQYWGGATGELVSSSYATGTGPLGRTYFLGAIMSGAAGSTYLTDAGLELQGVPMVRGVLMAASGTILQLSSAYGPGVTGAVNLNSGKQEFTFIINGHTNTDPFYPHTITASYDITAPNYFGSVLNRDPLKLEEAGYYLQTDWPVHPALAVVTASGVIPPASASAAIYGGAGYEPAGFLITGSMARNSGSTTRPNYESWENRFTTPKSPWIKSQLNENLFRIHSLDDGTYANTRVKLSIQNLKPSISDSYLYGTFDLLVRDFNDNDNHVVALESFIGLSLDPSSVNYVAKVIGDYNTFFNFDALEGSSRLVTNGTYTNNSKYIRVEVASRVDSGDINAESLPVGFRGPWHLMTSGSDPLATFSDVTGSGFISANPFYKTVQPPVPFRENLSRGASGSQTSDSALYWGVQFERKIDAFEKNKAAVQDPIVASFTSYFPDFSTEYMNVVVGDNEGTADTAENGIIDADRFNYNAFSLTNIQCTTVAIPGTTATFPLNVTPDLNTLYDWTYKRAGNPVSGSNTRGLLVSDLVNDSVRRVAKFNFFLQGGFDGVNIFNYDETFMTNKAIDEELLITARGEQTGSVVTAFNTALDLLSDSTELDLQLFAIPGIRNTVITDRALQIAENRFDALYLMDMENYDINNSVVTNLDTQQLSVTNTTTNHRDRGINSSFGATYFPDVIMEDNMGDSLVLRNVPASIAALGAFSYNDRVSYPWFAPAGFARGGLPTVRRATLELSRTNMDTLYQANINPIVSFAGSDGLVIWGQKTLYAQQSSLDRVNVRRLLLSLRRQVRQVAMRILFEQTLPATLARFSQLVNPILQKVQSQNGLDRYLVQIDASTTTQADFENKTIRGKIFVQPRKTLEFLGIDFIINNPNNFGQG